MPTPQTGSPSSGTEQPNPGISQETTDALDPCSLLTAEELAQFGVSAEPKFRLSAGARNCYWSPQLTDAHEKLPIVDVDIRDNVGVSGVVDLDDGIRRGQMEGTGREIAQTSNDVSCLYALALGDNARVDVLVSRIEIDQACDMVLNLAEIIDPKLPMG